MCKDGSLSGRGGCFYWPTLANEAAGGPILRKGAYKHKCRSLIWSFIKEDVTVCDQGTGERQLALQLACVQSTQD